MFDQPGVEIPASEIGRSSELLSELDRLEQMLQEITVALEKLRAQNRQLERECEELRQERNQTVARLTRLIEKVDLVRGGN